LLVWKGIIFYTAAGLNGYAQAYPFFVQRLFRHCEPPPLPFGGEAI
jgi:hypothetical protein